MKEDRKTIRVFCKVVSYKHQKTLMTNQNLQVNFNWSSYKEHRANALAPGADEGRGKLRKASGRRTQPLIRRYPNGATRLGKA